MIFEGIGLSSVPLVAFTRRALEGGCGLGYSKKKMKIIFEIPQLLKTPELIFYGIGLSPTSTLTPKENGLCINRTHSKMLYVVMINSYELL